jgi:uncharacterized protein YpmS
VSVSGATGSALALTSVETNNAGTYSVLVGNVAGSVTSSSATLAVLVPVGIATQPSSQTVIQGSNVVFSVVPCGTAPFTYQWSFNGVSVSGATDSALALTSVETNNAGIYSVLVGNVAGSVTSSSATLGVLVPVGIATQPSSQTVIQGSNAVFSVVPSGTAPFSYQWSCNGTDLAESTNAALTFTNAQATNAGSYKVVVTNSWGSVTSAVVTLTVLVPPAITNQPQSQAVVQGQNASFSVGAIGTPTLSYQWYFNGSSLGTGPTNSTLILSGIGTNKAGNYTVTVNNSYGSVTSTVATLTVYVPPVIAIQPLSQTVTQGLNASLSVTASGTEPLSYQWIFSGTNLAGATTSVLVLTNLQATNAGSYTVVVTNSAGSITSAPAMLAVTNPPPPAPPSMDAAGMTTNGFALQLSVPVGRTYTIWVTTNLQDWTPISTNVAETGTVLVTDTAATNFGTRFYRAMIR